MNYIAVLTSNRLACFLQIYRKPVKPDTMCFDTHLILQNHCKIIGNHTSSGNESKANAVYSTTEMSEKESNIWNG